MVAPFRHEDPDGIEPGKRLVRVDGEMGASLAERLSRQLAQLAWRTPLHRLRLRGRYPLKLLAVPADPFAGDAAAGESLLAGHIYHRGESVDAATLDFVAIRGSPAFIEHLQGFAWLRDLAAAAPREQAAPVAELIMRRWLAGHAEQVDALGWRPDLWGARVLAWTAHAPLLLSSSDRVYRSTVLNTLARGARHLDRSADRAAPGLPRITAWAGVVAAGLLIPGGELRMARGEAGLGRAIAGAVNRDGGVMSRAPVEQLALVELLARLRAVYEVRRIAPSPVLLDALRRAVPALKGVTLGDGGLASCQGGAPVSSTRVETAIRAADVRARPLRHARDWGYERLVGGRTVAVVDAGPPPASRLLSGGCASTLAIELSDGPHRVFVNCGGDRGATVGITPALGNALRATAAHSTLVLGDMNSTAIHADGTLGKGVGAVEIARREEEAGSWLDAAHDGYARRLGFIHHRHLFLAMDGRELRGCDVLTPRPSPQRKREPARGTTPVTIRFHLHPGVEVAAEAGANEALLRVAGANLWWFRAGAQVAIEDSLWIDGDGVPRPTLQLVVRTQAQPGGGDIAWSLSRTE